MLLDHIACIAWACEPCKSGWTDQGDIWAVDSSGPTHTHTPVWMPFFQDYPGEPVQERSNQSGFYWSKRQLVAVASAGPYASLHLAPDRQPHQHPTTLFLQAGCPSCHPTNSVKALKAISSVQLDYIVGRNGFFCRLSVLYNWVYSDAHCTVSSRPGEPFIQCGGIIIPLWKWAPLLGDIVEHERTCHHSWHIQHTQCYLQEGSSSVASD